MRFVTLVLLILTSYGCSSRVREGHPIEKTLNKTNETPLSHYQQSVLKVSTDYSEIKIKDITAFPSYENRYLDLYEVGYPFNVINNNGYNYIVSKSTFKIFRYDNKFSKKISEFGRNGRGPGEGSFINAVSISDNGVVIYDSSLNKLVSFSPDGNLNFEKIINNNRLPYHLNSILNVQDDVYLATGISREEWLKLNRKSIYNNVYLLEIDLTSMELIDKKSLLPMNIENAILTNDIISSTVTSPFSITKGQDYYFLFNLSSKTVYMLEVLNNHIEVKKEISLGQEFFKHHPAISEDEMLKNPKKAEAWRLNGNYFINIFQNSHYIFYYMSEIKDNATIYNLIITDFNENVIKKVTMPISSVIRYIDDEHIHFFSFDDSQDEYIYESVSIKDVFECSHC